MKTGAYIDYQHSVVIHSQSWGGLGYVEKQHLMGCVLRECYMSGFGTNESATGACLLSLAGPS